MRKRETLIVKLDKYVCILFIFAFFYAHSHEVNIYIQKRFIQHKKYIYVVAFYSFYHFFFLLVHSFDGRLCMYDAFFITRKIRRRKRRKASKIKEALRRKEEIWREKNMILLPSYIFLGKREGSKEHLRFDKELKICWIYIKNKIKLLSCTSCKNVYRTCTFAFVDEFKSSVGDEEENLKRLWDSLNIDEGKFSSRKSCLRNA